MTGKTAFISPPAQEPLPVFLGKTIEGERLFIDLSVSNPLIISGVCGSGKTIYLRSLLSELISSNSAEKLQIITAKTNPYCDELEDIISNHKDFFRSFSAEKTGDEFLQILIDEVHRRYRLFDDSGFHSFSAYNAQSKKTLPHLIVAIDSADRLFRASEKALRDRFFETVVRMWSHFCMTLVATIQSLSLLAPWQYVIPCGSHIMFRTLDSQYLPYPNLDPHLLRCLEPGAHLFASRNCEPISFQPTY